MKKKKTKKKKDNEDTLTKILILVIFIIFVFYVPNLWKSFDITTKVKKGLWELGAEDNLDAELIGIEGEEYIFINGLLKSNCDRAQSDNHCPQTILNADKPIFFDKTNSFYKPNIYARIKRLNQKGEDIILNPDDIKIISFINKSDKNIKFQIRDEILNGKICPKPKFNNTFCSINWEKEFKIENIATKRRDVSVQLVSFEVKQKEGLSDIEVQGKITGNLIEPFMKISIYLYNQGPMLANYLEAEKIINLTPENDYHTFHTKIIITPQEINMGNITYDDYEAEEDIASAKLKTEGINFTKTEKVADLDILLLFQDQNYFYANRRIVQKGIVTETVYK
ncbi:MAG: hypothetical protein KKF46_06555 [Nanoarchaeota archaeon]|nr:hypothetical protein [Nanoarchaeota archaeon]MBU1321990.1 hypothetical protein [Nanoarchaeota archaeon]MBU1597980.1 hypothetical protein [Nanoarchaeota archaeon]MBU2441701.1 hypothetical protein [Nanoarchaeota archaeon]